MPASQEEIERRLTALEARHGELNDKADEVLDILRASKFGVGLIKWLSTVGGGIAALWVLVRGRP